MAEIDDGGPAFPQGSDYVEHPIHGRIHRSSLGDEIQTGMSRRDWLAGQALAGLCSNPALTPHDPYWRKKTVENAYALADAMLAESKRRPT